MTATFDQIVQAIRKKQPARLYLLAGDEPYYIDKLTKLFETLLLSEEDRDFNYTQLYAQGDDLHKQVVADAMRYPMMAERVLVIVREAQQMPDIDGLAVYLPSLPESSTVVLAYKKKPDKRKAWYKACEQSGVVFESTRIPDYRLSDFINGLVASKGLLIDPRSSAIMADHLGNDLAKIDTEIDKLLLALASVSTKQISPEIIEEHIGISKEYNNFELLRAVQQRDKLKAYRIARQFGANERVYPLQPTIAVLFNYFASLMVVCYLPTKSTSAIKMALGLKQDFQVRDYQTGLKSYGSRSVFEIIRHLRRADAVSKGVDVGSTQPNGEILSELLSRIFAS